MSDGRCRIAEDGVRHRGALGAGHACHRVASNLNSFAAQPPSQENLTPVIRSGERAEAPRCFAISTTFGFQLPIFLPSSIWEKCSSWSRCTQPPWSVNWIYGYQPYFSPFSASQIQEYHATCERKDKQENRLTMKSQPEA